ncbi:MAG: sulfurtransferase [Proteobacteria bacterium]|nr:sulfurtransferase [Pseudomonadota bacterium]
MRWKQFFTPVKLIDANQVRDLIKETDSHHMTILDVRQPNEYEEGHIPGATLIPLPQLDKRFHEIDPSKQTIVYCAIGGRSRIAAQFLAGNGFGKLINLSGGFKAWNGESAYGREKEGLELFSGNESPEKTLGLAYSLEQGLHDFYVTMEEKVNNNDAQQMFRKLSSVELIHQDRIYLEYMELTKNGVSKKTFVNTIVSDVMEGGLTTEEYIRMFNPDMTSPREITEIAMSIEAQALDLYFRAAKNASDERSRTFLLKIADEERIHLAELGKLMERI